MIHLAVSSSQTLEIGGHIFLCFSAMVQLEGQKDKLQLVIIKGHIG